MPKRSSGFPYDATPDVHQFRGVPESCFDLVNMYGTYNIQPTGDTEHLFPLIGPGLPLAGYAHRQAGSGRPPVTAQAASEKSGRRLCPVEITQLFHR